MLIRIRYLLRGEEVARLLELSPVDYFDPLDDDDESFDVRSVPKHEHEWAYTECRPDQLWWTFLEVREGESYWEVRTQFLDGERSMMTHSRESDGSEELIHQTEVGPGCWHVVRTLREPGKDWTVVVNSLFAEKPCELLRDHDYFGETSREQRIGFGELR